MHTEILCARVALLALLLAAPACKHLNHYCEGQPHNECPDDAAIDMMPEVPVCTDTGCDSGVCLSTGSCAAVTDVAHVANGGSGTTCTKEAPCDHLSTGLATQRRYVKVSGAIAEVSPIPVEIRARDVTIIGDDTADVRPVSGSAANDLLLIGDGGHVEIRDLGLSHTSRGSMHNPFAAVALVGSGASATLVRARIHDNPGAALAVRGGADMASLTVLDSTINDNGGGIWAEGDTGTLAKQIVVDNCHFERNDGTAIFVNTTLLTLRVSRSFIADNVGGGINVRKGSFQIVGNVIVRNEDSPASVTAGVLIEPLTEPGGRFDFNTVALNLGFQVTSGVECGRSLTLRGNILFHNGDGPFDDVLGDCVMVDTLTSDDDSDPLFTSDFHLQPQSPARGKVPPGWLSDELSGHDIDGDPRPSKADQGADQVP